MALPAPIQEAADRMQKAEADLRADIESGQPYDIKRRNKLTQDLIESQARFLNAVLELGAQMAAE